MVVVILTSEEVMILDKTEIVINVLSLFFCFLLIVTYLVFKRGFPHTGVLMFSVCAFMLSFFLLWGSIFSFAELAREAQLCQVQAFGIQFFGMAAVCYYFALVLNLYSIVKD